MKIKSKEIETDSDKPTHILIEGDNYHALSVLNYTHEKAIDVIYIDPPYNTGNKDFHYNDTYVEKEDPYRHSKWLSFISKRLKLARNLLKDSGIVFISIDDNELAQLKLLCDDIFRENNFRNSIVVSRVKKNINERSFVKSLNLGHGTLFFYARSENSLLKIPTKYQQKAERWHAFDAPGIRNTMEYELFGQKPPKGRHWMFEEERAKEMMDNGLLRRNPKTGSPQYKLEASDVTLLDTNWTDIQEGDSNWKFENGEKNVEFIKRLLGMYPSNDCIVLDFFAGSGTTAEAVMELNKQDEGIRQCILVTNNENNICADFCYPRIQNVIQGYEYEGNEKNLLFEEELTINKLENAQEIYDIYQNLRRENKQLFDNVKGELKNNVLRLWGLKKTNGWKQGLGGNLKYYRTSFVPSETTDKNKELLTKQSIEMLCLRENTFEIVTEADDYKIFRNNNKYTGIIFDQLSIQKFKNEAIKFDKPISVYVFSLGDDDFSDEFSDMKDKVKVCSIPEAILRVYRRIFK